MKVFFVYFYLFLPPLLNIFCFCYVHTVSVLYCTHLCMKCSLGISNFLEEISKSVPFCCFPLFLCIDCWGRLSCLSLLFFGTLHSNGYIFPFLLCLSLLCTAICKASSDNHFAFFHCFLWGCSCSLPPVQCHESPSIVLQALCLSDLILWICLSLPLYNCKGFDLGHTSVV